MDPEAIIESYVGDIVRRLPRRQRNDVGFELRSLLHEELAGRAADLGRPADEAMAMDLLTAFGRPQDVADRYRPAGFTVIRPADAPTLRLAGAGRCGTAVGDHAPGRLRRIGLTSPRLGRLADAGSSPGGSPGDSARSGGPAS